MEKGKKKKKKKKRMKKKKKKKNEEKEIKTSERNGWTDGRKLNSVH